MICGADFVEIGFLKKLYGTDGAFILKLSIQQTNNWFLNEKEPIFIEIDGNLVPFFMDEIRQHISDPIVHFDNILSRESAVNFLEKSCFYDKKMLHDTETTPTIENLAGYTLIDKSSGLELAIQSTNLIPGNPLLEVVYKDETFDIPFIESAIESFDPEKSTLYTNYPEGLLESLLEME